jgi:hypothetical protein
MTRRHEFVSENLTREQNILETQGISGREITMRRSASRTFNNRMGAGDITMELAKNGMGRWFNMMLGGTSTITQQGLTTAWLQTHTLGTLLGKSLTVQKALRDGAATLIDSFTFEGVKVTEWEFTLETDSIPTLRVGLDAEDVISSTATAALLALPEPGGSGNFTFKDGAILINATPGAKVLGATIGGGNGLRTDAFYIGSTGVKAEPEVNDWRTVTGQIRVEYLASTYYDLFETDANVALDLTLTGNVISGSFFEECNFLIPRLHFTGGAPVVGGTGVIEQTIPFTAAYNDVDNPIAIEYMSTDTVI